MRTLLSGLILLLAAFISIFPLPSGSGTFEIEITSSGTDTAGLIQLVMKAGGNVEYRFDCRAFETISSIFEKKERFALERQNERIPSALCPALHL